MGGAVQHGASTLPGSQLAKFPATGAVEIHLALGFNNLIFDHPRLPAAIKDQIRDYVFANHAAERKPGETDAQFLYNTRKKAWKVVKKPFWEMPVNVTAVPAGTTVTTAELVLALARMFMFAVVTARPEPGSGAGVGLGLGLGLGLGAGAGAGVPPMLRYAS